MMENILKIVLLFGIDVTGDREKYVNHSVTWRKINEWTDIIREKKKQRESIVIIDI
jgi:hypothetical protein